MLSDKISITQIGLNQADLRLIETVFKLSAELKQNYTLSTQTLLENADIVFLDADSDASLQQWEVLKLASKQSTAIKVTSNPALVDEALVLSRPLSLKKLMSTLQSVTSTAKPTTSNVVNINESSKRILVVDDSYSVRKYMEHKLPELSSSPISIEFADSGEAAMQILEKQSFDVIFLDVVMPGIDGYQVCKWVKAEQPTYVVMLTSKKSPFDKVRGNMSGCNAYITKPPKDERIKKVLQKGIEASIKSNAKNEEMNNSTRDGTFFAV